MGYNECNHTSVAVRNSTFPTSDFCYSAKSKCKFANFADDGAPIVYQSSNGQPILIGTITYRVNDPDSLETYFEASPIVKFYKDGILN